MWGLPLLSGVSLGPGLGCAIQIPGTGGEWTGKTSLSGSKGRVDLSLFEGRNRGGSQGTGPGWQSQEEPQKFPLLIRRLYLSEAALADLETRAGLEGQGRARGQLGCPHLSRVTK